MTCTAVNPHTCSKEARTILVLYIISARPSKQPLMVRTFLKVYMELGSYFTSARTNIIIEDIIITVTVGLLPGPTVMPTVTASSL
jgi:hypothetical protein